MAYDQLQQQLREERDERRGLEQRAGSLVASQFVAVGLSTTAAAQVESVPDAAWGLVLLAAALWFFTLIGLTSMLAGAHTNDEFRILPALRNARKPEGFLKLYPVTMSEGVIEELRVRVERQVRTNEVAVLVLRLATLSFSCATAFLVAAGLLIASS